MIGPSDPTDGAALCAMVCVWSFFAPRYYAADDYRSVVYWIIELDVAIGLVSRRWCCAGRKIERTEGSRSSVVDFFLLFSGDEGSRIRPKMRSQDTVRLRARSREIARTESSESHGFDMEGFPVKDPKAARESERQAASVCYRWPDTEVEKSDLA